MKHHLLAAVAAIALTGGLGAAAPASATVIAVFNPVPAGSGGTAGFVPNFTADGAGNLTSTTTATPTLVAFGAGQLGALGNLASTFNFSASESAPATVGMLGGVAYVTTAFDGSFSYTYTGKDVKLGSYTLDSGDVLLRGTFSNAQFAGPAAGPGAGLFDNSLTLGTVTYSSDLPSSVLPLGTTGQSFTIGFADISPVLAIDDGHLAAFNAVGDGKFSSDLTGGGGGGGVPEPATWALMLVGVSGIGACLRRRERSAASVA